MTGRLEGKVAIITGATGGIGAATARRLASDEGCLLVLGGRSAKRRTQPAAELDAEFVQADLDVDDAPGRLARGGRPVRMLISIPSVRASRRWAIRCASPASVLARW